MKQKLPGTVQVTVKGRAYPVVLQRLHQQSVPLHGITSSGDNEVQFYLSYQSLQTLRKAVFKTGCKIHLKRGQGLIYEIENLFNFKSFIVWLLVAIVLVMGSTRFLWAIELEGATPETRQEVGEALRDQGFLFGTLKRKLPAEDQIAPVLYDEIEQLSWMGLEWRGTKLVVHLKEKQGITINEQLTPSHIVAAKKGTIQSMNIESGQAVENVNSVVKKGQLIVTGLVGREEDKHAVPSKGVVMAETWYEVNVSIPEQLTREALTGKEKKKFVFQVGNIKTPPLSFSRESFVQFAEEEVVAPLKIFGIKLPVQKHVISMYETVRTQTKVDLAEAKKIGLSVAREEVLSIIGGKGRIEQEKFLHEQNENGKVKLTIYLQAIEDIAKVQPFSEETRE
ncbi:sporulation protein YqfD [Jeotgalibacillus proteolyticus]|uniref:Sporulation protein YqfD n=1 Tax=Jeotgalibacillus proteolyticus TaxID=2082395 RepID=A0A2S5GEH4_9BACL|nr:sporulation protein YqfD [Jeotgalibacillus proteolyticus]PPA71452.1 hypothetical protein C4B60_05160 [Jeotgalibacillus proteolyticus]